MLIINMTIGDMTPKKVTVPGNRILPLMTRINNTAAKPDAEA